MRNRLFSLFSVIVLFLLVVPAVYAANATNSDDLMTEKANDANVDGKAIEKPDGIGQEIEELKQEIEQLRNDRTRDIFDSYERNAESTDRLINTLGMFATVIGIIIALAGIFIGWEALKASQQRKEAIQSLEDAEKYVNNKVKEIESKVKDADTCVNEIRDKLSAAKEYEALISNAGLKPEFKPDQPKIDIPHETDKRIKELESKLDALKDIALPTDVGIYVDKAKYHYNKGELENALENLKKVIELDPYNAYAHYNLGILLSKLGRNEEAEKEYRVAIRINPEYASAHNNLGNLLSKLDKNEEAEKEYRVAIRINPEYASAHNNLGHLLSKLDKNEEAEKEYAEAIRINPEDASPVGNLAELYLKTGKYQKAEKLLKGKVDIFKGTEELCIARFLNICTSLLQNEDRKAKKQITGLIGFLKGIGEGYNLKWNFSDLEATLKEKLSADNHRTTQLLTKLLKEEISIEDFEEELIKK